MLKRIRDEEINRQFEEYLDALDSLVRIESVEADPLPGAPFGEGPRAALAKALEIAEDWGFRTVNLDHVIGYAEWKNDETSDDYIGVLGHLDVVPAGTGWSSGPFALTVRNGKAYGRGVLDNKGPVLASLFAAKLLKDSGEPFRHNLRIIFGTNEETGSKDLPLYLASEQPPVYGFTPDSQFPVVYGEKGIVVIRYQTRFASKELAGLSIKGDFISSSVPDQATVSLKDGSKRIFNGRRAPSNEPQLGQNALTLAAEELQENQQLSSSLRAYFRWIANVFHDRHFGEGLQAKRDSSIKDMDIQITPYRLQIAGDLVEFDVSYRYSIDYTQEQILALLAGNLYPGTEMVLLRSLLPKTADPTHPMMRVMKRVYEEVTGLDGTPIVTTGATYARFMPNMVAFGPSFPGQIGIAHNSDEYMDLDDLKRNILIYKRTLSKLLR